MKLPIFSQGKQGGARKNGKILFFILFFVKKPLIAGSEIIDIWANIDYTYPSIRLPENN
jgi:hypothetical protein